MSALEAAEELIAKLNRAEKAQVSNGRRAILATRFPASKVVLMFAVVNRALFARVFRFGCLNKLVAWGHLKRTCSEITQHYVPKIWLTPGLLFGRIVTT
jgi:hypothetical protein